MFSLILTQFTSPANLSTDNFCWNGPNHVGADGATLHLNPQEHSKMCMLLSNETSQYACIENGYAILQQDASGFFTYAYELNEASNALAVNFIDSADQEKDFLVKFAGSVDDSKTIELSSLDLCANSGTINHVGYIVGKNLQILHCHNSHLPLFLFTDAFSIHFIDNFCWNGPEHTGAGK